MFSKREQFLRLKIAVITLLDKLLGRGLGIKLNTTPKPQVLVESLHVMCNSLCLQACFHQGCACE